MVQERQSLGDTIVNRIANSGINRLKHKRINVKR